VYAGGVAQGVECLPIKCTALNSNHQKEKEKHVKKQRVQCVKTQVGEGGWLDMQAGRGYLNTRGIVLLLCLPPG
jgi:hypothetical protein